MQIEIGDIILSNIESRRVRYITKIENNVISYNMFSDKGKQKIILKKETVIDNINKSKVWKLIKKRKDNE